MITQRRIPVETYFKLIKDLASYDPYFEKLESCPLDNDSGYNDPRLGYYPSAMTEEEIIQENESQISVNKKYWFDGLELERVKKSKLTGKTGRRAKLKDLINKMISKKK